MSRRTATPTLAQQARFDAIQELGCIACRQRGHPGRACDIHHLIDGGRCIGHDATVGLCPWHHRGLRLDGWSASECRTHLGPSMAINPGLFRREFGREQAQLEYQNKLLARDIRLSA